MASCLRPGPCRRFLPPPAPYTWRSPSCRCLRALRVLCSWCTLFLSLFHASAYCGLFPGGRTPRTGPSLLCPRTSCYVPLFGMRLLVPFSCPFFSLCVLGPPLLWPLGHQLATPPQSAPPGPAWRRGSLSGSVRPVQDVPVRVKVDTVSSFPLVPGGPSCPPLRQHRSSVLSSYLPDSPPSAGHQALPLPFSILFLHFFGIFWIFLR